MKSFALQFFIAACFVNLAVSLPHYQFASHRKSKVENGSRIGSRHACV